MKNTSIAGALIVSAMFAGSAIAADLKAPAPVYKAPMMAAPVFSWTGCYLGGGGGYGMWNQEIVMEDTLLVPFTQSSTSGGRGWFGTAQVGCDYQVSSSWVIGAFGDWDFGSLKGTAHFTDEGISIGDETNNWTWAVGGRVGYVIMPQLLGYVSGGYTQAHFNQVNLVDGFDGDPLGNSVAAQTYHGWFLGTGYEYALQFLPGLFWKTEYRYSSFRAADVPIFDSTGTTFEMANSKKFIQTVRSELVWRFNWGH
jgi:outer membrane immunogenic protein